jgi:ferredoxin
MKAIVNKDTCIGCELCVESCPEVFVMDGNVAKAKVDEVPAEFESACREAAKDCPVEAISIE